MMVKTNLHKYKKIKRMNRKMSSIFMRFTDFTAFHGVPSTTMFYGTYI